MRDVNFFSVINNKAAANMTPTMYDRRALDCPFDRPLVNSLSSLCVLVTSSQIIRESLATDGGIDRLIAVLKSCQGMHSRDLLTSWKWSLALQCLSAVGVRGSEAVRRRVVEADIVPVLATVLDNFLEAIEKLRLYHDYFVKQSSQNHQANIDVRNTLIASPFAQTNRQILPSPLPQVPRQRQHTQDDSEQESQEPRRRQRRNATDEPIFDSGIDVNAADMFVSMIGAAVATHEEAPDRATQEPEQTGRAENAEVGGEVDTGNNNSYLSRIHYHMYHHHHHHHRHQHRHHHSYSHSHTHSHASPSIAAASREQSTAEGRDERVDSAIPMDVDETEVESSSNARSIQVAADVDDGPNSSSDDVQYSEAPSYSADIQTRIIDMEYSNGFIQSQAAAESSGSSGSVFDVPQNSNDSQQPAESDSSRATSARPPLSPFGGATLPVVGAALMDPSPEQGPDAPFDTTFPGASPTSTNLPAFLGAQDNLPREEDVLMSLQLLAYVSKYVNLRPYFQNTHIIPSLSIRTDISELAGSNKGKKSAGLDDTSLFPEDESLIADEYKLPTLNLFQLVERFTTRAYMGDLHYWASVIMRNSCRKDDSRGGVRQCGYFECGKWEEYPKQFAKCRRCRRTKYCSKSCQSKAWYFHRHWCVPPE